MGLAIIGIILTVLLGLSIAYAKLEQYNILWSIFLSILVLAAFQSFPLLGKLIINNQEFIGSYLRNPYWVVPIGTIIAIGFFIMKTKLIFSYGTIELIVGAFAIYLATQSPSNTSVLVRLFAIAGGVYIIVRALDNQTKGFPDAIKSIKGVWARLRPDPSFIVEVRSPGIFADPKALNKERVGDNRNIRTVSSLHLPGADDT